MVARPTAFPKPNTGYESVEMEETTLLDVLIQSPVIRIIVFAAAGIAIGMGLAASIAETWWPLHA